MLLLKKIDACNFADGTTPFACRKTLGELLEKLERNSELAIHWFEDNYMTINTEKCNLLMSIYKYEHQLAQIAKNMAWEENKVKFLGTDKELKFDSHVLNICLKVNENLSVLCRLKNILTFQQIFPFYINIL